MAEYKLTTVATFSDNTECEEYGDLQDYVEKVAKDILSNWDTASVLLEVDGKKITTSAQGNRHENEEDYDSALKYHPWYKASEERPKTMKKDIKLLAWFEGNGPSYEYDIIKYRSRDGEFCNLHGHPLMTDKLWWRYLAKPNLTHK